MGGRVPTHISISAAYAWHAPDARSPTRLPCDPYLRAGVRVWHTVPIDLLSAKTGGHGRRVSVHSDHKTIHRENKNGLTLVPTKRNIGSSVEINSKYRVVYKFGSIYPVYYEWRRVNAFSIRTPFGYAAPISHIRSNNSTIPRKRRTQNHPLLYAGRILHRHN